MRRDKGSKNANLPEEIDEQLRTKGEKHANKDKTSRKEPKNEQ